MRGHHDLAVPGGRSRIRAAHLFLLLTLVSQPSLAEQTQGEEAEGVAKADVAAPSLTETDADAQENPAEPSTGEETQAGAAPQHEAPQPVYDDNSVAGPPAPATESTVAESTVAEAPALDEPAVPIDPAMLGEFGIGRNLADRPLVSVGGFAVVNLQTSSLDPMPRFEIGQLTLHTTMDLGPHFGGFAEVTVNSVPSWEVRVERLLLYWEPNDLMKLSVGRYHIPVTWWNATFHHGLWLQTTIRRPAIVGFNDAFVPNHAVGVMVDGRVPGLDLLALRYHASVTGGGNDHYYTHASHDAEAPRLAYTGALYVEPPALHHLRVGAVLYRDPERVRNGRVTPETTAGAHLAWSGEAPEFITEVVVVNHEEQGGGNPVLRTSYGGYAQAAWRLPWMQQAWKPYGRFDWIWLDDGDVALDRAESQVLGTLGLRFDPVLWLACKVDGAVRRIREQEPEFLGAFQLEAAW